MQAMTSRRALSFRKLDILYITFFACHIPATLLIDLQTLYSPDYSPQWLKSLFQNYLMAYNDPIIGGVIGTWVNQSPTEWTWMRCFLWMEALFQLPLFFYGLFGLYNDNKKVYPWLLMYAASSTTTIMPCIATLFFTPIGATAFPGAQLSHAQFYILMGSYLPFGLITLIMTIDMAMRLSALLDHVSNKPKKD